MPVLESGNYALVIYISGNEYEYQTAWDWYVKNLDGNTYTIQAASGQYLVAKDDGTVGPGDQPFKWDITGVNNGGSWKIQPNGNERGACTAYVTLGGIALFIQDFDGGDHQLWYFRPRT